MAVIDLLKEISSVYRVCSRVNVTNFNPKKAF